MTIRAICFDLDGVYFTPRGKESFHTALSTESGADPESVDEFMYRSETMGQLVRGQISNEEFFDRMRNELNIDVSDDEITERWVRDYEINQDVRHVVQRCKELGYKTCVCTNNNNVRLPALEQKCNFSGDFDVIVSSHQVGHCKPAPEIFQALIDQLDIKPSELLYSDDNPVRLQGVSEMGVECFVYENFEQFAAELCSRGIEVDSSKQQPITRYKIIDSYVKHFIPFMPKGYFTEGKDNVFRGVLERTGFARWSIQGTLVNSHGADSEYVARRYYLGTPHAGLFWSPGTATGYAEGYGKAQDDIAPYLILGLSIGRFDFGIMPGLYKRIPGIVFIKLTRENTPPLNGGAEPRGGCVEGEMIQ